MKWTQYMWKGWKISVLGTPEMSVTPLTRHRHKRSVRDIITVPGHNICFKDTTDISGISKMFQEYHICNRITSDWFGTQ